MVDKILQVHEAADLALLSDSDESLIENESDAENNFSLSSSGNDVEARSANASNGMDISDEEGSDPDAPSTSLSAQSLHGRISTQTKARNNLVWGPATRQPQLESFAGNPGPTTLANVMDIENCVEYFQLIIKDEILNIVVEETNRYADQFFLSKAGTLPTHSRANNWKPLTIPELKIFLGLTLATGLLDKRGHLSDYWSENPVLFTPFFGQTMSRNRYQNILKFLHFNNNATRPSDSTDKLYKLRPIHDKVVENWRALYNPGEQISIDEGMLKWRGRLSFRVYNKNKSTKYGIKAYILADANSGYCWNMDIYYGQGKRLRDTVFGLLTDTCLHCWHSLYMNNFYNSVELSEELLAVKVHTVGTLGSHQGEPPKIRSAKTGTPKMKAGDSLSVDNGKVMVVAWKDKRVVTALSTKHDGSLSAITRRKKNGHGETEQIVKPICVTEYNQYMSGVDRLDQMISYYPFTRKTMKWPKKVFFYLLEVSLWNSFVLYKAKNIQAKLTLRSFHLKVIEKLCQISNDSSSSSNDEEPPARVPRYDSIERLKGGFQRHQQAFFPATDKKKFPQRRCRVCQKNGIRKDTRVFCKKCKVPLCPNTCFFIYHSRKLF